MAASEIELKWQGFFSVGDFAEASVRPERQSGIYLMVRWHGEKPSVYVGSAGNISSRLKSHLGNVLALGYYTREDDDASWFPRNSKDLDFWLRVQNLEAETERSKKVVLTTQLAWAVTDPDRANAAERAAYFQLKAAEDAEMIYFDNTTGIEKRRGQLHDEVLPIHTGSPEVLKLFSPVQQRPQLNL
ncbi:MAG: GIY-YIG nuclease family protein [Aliihoeflea sp.]